MEQIARLGFTCQRRWERGVEVRSVRQAQTVSVGLWWMRDSRRCPAEWAVGWIGRRNPASGGNRVGIPERQAGLYGGAVQPSATGSGEARRGIGRLQQLTFTRGIALFRIASNDRRR